MLGKVDGLADLQPAAPGLVAERRPDRLVGGQHQVGPEQLARLRPRAPAACGRRTRRRWRSRRPRRRVRPAAAAVRPRASRGGSGARRIGSGSRLGTGSHGSGRGVTVQGRVPVQGGESRFGAASRSVARSPRGLQCAISAAGAASTRLRSPANPMLPPRDENAELVFRFRLAVRLPAEQPDRGVRRSRAGALQAGAVRGHPGSLRPQGTGRDPVEAHLHLRARRLAGGPQQHPDHLAAAPSVQPAAAAAPGDPARQPDRRGAPIVRLRLARRSPAERHRCLARPARRAEGGARGAGRARGQEGAARRHRGGDRGGRVRGADRRTRRPADLGLRVDRHGDGEDRAGPVLRKPGDSRCACRAGGGAALGLDCRLRAAYCRPGAPRIRRRVRAPCGARARG